MPPGPAPARRTDPDSVFVVDDHPLVIEGIRSVLSRTDAFCLTGTASTASAARAWVRENRPSLVVADMLLGGITGLEDGLALVSDLRYEAPGTRILALTSVESGDFARRALEAGAAGYMLKSEPLTNLPFALGLIQQDRQYLSPCLFVESAQRVLATTAPGSPGHAFSHLTNREIHVLHATALGFPNRRIASDLGISVKTVETHKESIKRKLDLADSAGLAQAATLYLDVLRG
jgi:DNA-binding NarL/FixJ family response regulator